MAIKNGGGFMRFFGAILLIGVVMVYYSFKSKDIMVGVLGLFLAIASTLILIILASKSNKKPEGDPSTKVEVHNHYYDGKKKP